MLIYRVEHKENRTGPFYYNTVMFNGHSLGEIFLEMHTVTHRVPFADGIGSAFRHGFEVCGCVSLSQLAYWFKPYISVLAEAGFVIRVFEDDEEEVKIGRTQVAFCRGENHIVETLPLTVLADESLPVFWPPLTIDKN